MEEVLIFITNNHDLGSTTIADVYKDRWQIDTLGGPETKPQEQSISWDQCQHSEDSSLDSIDSQADPSAPTAAFPISVVSSESGRYFTYNSFYQSESLGLVEWILWNSYRSIRAGATDFGPKLNGTAKTGTWTKNEISCPNVQ